MNLKPQQKQCQEEGKNTAIKKESRLDDFEIQYKLGEGAYGYVFLASKHNTEYAIKQINKHKLKRQHHQHQPLVEKQVLKTVNHPGIIKSYCAFQNTNNLYIVLQYCSGGKFQHLLNQKLLTEDHKKYYFAELVNIVEYLHKHKIIHRDLKPENLLLTKDGHLKLIDFGTAHITDSPLISEVFKSKLSNIKESYTDTRDEHRQKNERKIKKKRSSFVGTTSYLSPELILFSQCSTSADIWALGCILYYFYYGHGPFQENGEFQVYQKIKQAKVQYPNNFQVSPQALDLMKKLLVKVPEQRLGSCSRPQMSFEALKSHPYFNGINVDKIFENDPPYIKTSSRQIEEILSDLKLTANLSLRQPSFDNIFEKLVVKKTQDQTDIYLCHFKKEPKLFEYKILDDHNQPTVYELVSDNEGKVTHILSENKFSIGVKGQRIIYSSKGAEQICKFLNSHYRQIIKRQNVQPNENKLQQ